MITPEDYRQIAYFWNEKGDFTRYTRWETIEPELRKTQPEFFRAYEALLDARRNFSFIVDTLESVCGKDEDE